MKSKQTKEQVKKQTSYESLVIYILIVCLVVSIFTMILLSYRNNEKQSDLEYCKNAYNDMSWKIYHNPCELYGTCNYSNEPYLNCSKYTCYGDSNDIK